MIDAASMIGTHDILWVTLDTLRYDVAAGALAEGLTPELARVLPGGRWEKRHSPGTFTYAAHQAFFAGFLPTPATPGPHARLFAAKFMGSETAVDQTAVFDAPDVITGLARAGYHTVCVGGVGFFNKLTPLGCVLPSLFAESHWGAELGVTDRNSTQNQVELAERIISGMDRDRRLFLFLNVSAMHQPNCIFAPGAERDTPATMAAALAYADRWLGVLLRRMRRRAPVLALVFSDHGTAYGEDGYRGHRVAHPVVWEVPYAEFVLPREAQ
jgi:hypothetical protein